MQRNKSDRQYSSDFVDLTNVSYKKVGVFANWFQGTRTAEERSENVVVFKPLSHVFKPGYLSLKHYCATIDDSTLNDSSFSLSVDVLTKILPRWRTKITFGIS